LQRSQRWL